jgi:hypothetical protein
VIKIVKETLRRFLSAQKSWDPYRILLKEGLELQNRSKLVNLYFAAKKWRKVLFFEQLFKRPLGERNFLLLSFEKLNEIAF